MLLLLCHRTKLQKHGALPSTALQNDNWKILCIFVSESLLTRKFGWTYNLTTSNLKYSRVIVQLVKYLNAHTLSWPTFLN